MPRTITRIAVTFALTPMVPGADFRCSYGDSDPTKEFDKRL
jgi:hypothetical protein